MTKKNKSKKSQNIIVFEKNKKKFPKNRAPGKTGISREPRNFRDFFFLKLNSLQVHIKKIKK